MDRSGYAGDALYIAWKLGVADDASAGNAQNRLAQGQHLNLYRLRSWVIVNGEVRALLAPSAPLEAITEAIWEEAAEPLSSRWIEGKRACATVARDIETAPVSLGLAGRPEEWRFSSAALE